MGADRTKFPSSSRARAELFSWRGGVCHITGRKIGPGEKWDVEHIVAKSLFHEQDKHKADHWDNLAPALVQPHRGPGGKTASDRAKLSKSDRVRLKHLGLWKPKTPVRGSKKHPLGEKKKADGSTVLRSEDGNGKMR